jgi:hypothetical protein
MNSALASGKNITVAVLAATALLAAACGGSEPAPTRDPAAEETARAAKAAEDQQRRRDDDTGKLAARASEVEQRWKEMEGKIANKSATATTALRAEVKEDLSNVQQAIADLKTTSPENWWERHERAVERTADDIAEDVGRFAKKPAAPTKPEAPASVAGAPFESRRDQFVDQLRSRVDGMEKQLEGVRARGAQETELKDTRARIDKLQEDLDTLRKAEADEWWDISVARVGGYLDRLNDSIGRLDDNK